MKLLASRIFKDEAIGLSGSNLGKIVNIIFDFESLEARMLLFPEIKTGSWVWELINSAQYVGGEFLYPITDTFTTAEAGVVMRGVEEASKKVQTKLLDRAEEARETYFLVPVSEIRKMEGNKIRLEFQSTSYTKYINMPVGSADIAFFHDAAYNDPERYIGITLNLPSIRGLTIRDPDNRKARIIDLQFDVMESVVTDIIIQRPGKGVRTSLVPSWDIDFSSMECCNSLNDYQFVTIL